MEVKRKIVLLVFALTLAIVSNAQSYAEIDLSVFPNVQFVQPDPPKEIKGWTFIESPDDEIAMSQLAGDYPAKILKFQFQGDAVGIAVISNSDSGVIEFSVDNQPWQMQDMYVDDTRAVRYFTLEPELKAAKHMLQLRICSQKNPESEGYKCVLTQFYFNKTE